MKINEREIVIAICAFIVGFYFNSEEGSKLFKKEDTKPSIIAYVVSDTCQFCNKLLPILEKLQTQYKTKLNFIKLDISTDDTKKSAEELATKYGIGNFLTEVNGLPTLGVFCPNGGKEIKHITGLREESEYIKEFDEYIKNIKTTCTKEGDYIPVAESRT